MGPTRMGDGALRAVTVKSQVLRKGKRRLALGHPLVAPKVEVCVKTDGRLRRSSPKITKIPGYVLLSGLSRRRFRVMFRAKKKGGRRRDGP